MTKEKIIRARITSEDNKKFIERVEKTNLSKSEFIRQSVLTSKINDMDILRELYFELKKEGGNLNQLARQLNQYEPPAENKIEADLRELNKIYREIKKIIIELY
jgi:hypothetical protein